MEYLLYWWKDTSHTDPLTEGYIGISKRVKRRGYEHKNEHRDWWRPDLECVILKEGLSQVEARDIEREYRPKMHIGWNIATGGGHPPSHKGMKFPGRMQSGKDNHFYGKKHTEESLKKMSESHMGCTPWNRGIPRTEEEKDKMSESRIKHAEEKYLEIDRLVTSGISQTKACKQMGISRGAYFWRNNGGRKWL